MPDNGNVFKDIPLARIFAGIDIYVYVTDLQTDQIIFMNQKMRDLFGYDETCYGQRCWQLLQSGMTGRCSFCPVQILQEDPHEAIVWEERNTLNGRHYKNTDSLIEWSDGALVHLQHSVDITTEKLIRQSLMEAKWQADAANREKSDFLSRISHEIRTPLNAVIGMSKIALDTDDFAKAKECLERIDASSEHLLKTINDVLDMSKIEASKLGIVSRPFDFEKILVDIYNILSVSAAKKEIDFSIHMDEAMPRFFIGDNLRISQIIMNLASNAVKFTDGGGTVSVAVREKAGTAEQSEIEVKITDTGIGISEVSLPRLFAPFEQVDGGVTRKYGGSGLGLAISKNLAVMMGGDITVESKADVGSVFTFCAQLKRDPTAPQASPAIFAKKRTPKRSGQKSPKTDKELCVMGMEDFIDVEDALARVRGNKKIYKTLLQSFVRNSGMDALEDEIRAGHLAAAAKAAHAVKGASGNLSLTALTASIIRLEDGLKENRLDGEVLQKCREDFEKTKGLIDELLGQL